MVELPSIRFNPVMSPGSNVHLGPRPGALGSIDSEGSIQSIGSVGSVLSIGSAGSVLSIGSAGSILSIGSAGSVLSIGSIGSVASIGSALSVGAVGGWIERPGRLVEAGATLMAVAALATAALQVTSRR